MLESRAKEETVLAFSVGQMLQIIVSFLGMLYKNLVAVLKKTMS